MARHASVMLVVVLLLGSAVAAAEARGYDKPLEVTWDEAVKAARDVEFYVFDSNRDEHWFLMRTRRKGGYELEVTLSGGVEHAKVRVRTVDPGKAKYTARHIQRYLEALDRRME